MPSISTLWLLAGLTLCLMELMIPTAFFELTMGISALLMAVISRVLPSLTAQVILWLLISGILTLLLRRILPRKRVPLTLDNQQAKTLTAISPGETGRVLYEGNSWQARCADEQLGIDPNQSVYVVGRQGTTLMVLPESLVHS
ncbi:MAG: NfeD family protein [Pegethrix bostrychoides GSE-TBD4-15B]|uniref:NfeD family protein n=1 Tax=Pegethrix bostrychoides GSE-TBD4-15B TaxID=2839662 RepID=A0A951U5H8_9CYAN|nr:NfeD family protein [Pegethrix bostrychoides GSE-TBD4-15B]